MKSQISKSVITLCGIIFLGISGCSDSPVEPEKQMVDSGSWYETAYKWPHDGNPLESEHFVIYSDAASLEARQWLSQICEDTYLMIIETLGIADVSVFRFPADRNNKIHIYAYKNYFPTEWGGQAYYGGYIIYSPDHPQRTLIGHTEPENYIPLVQHELMHVIQTLILGANDERILYAWFAEGIAIQISDDIFYENIDSRQKLDSLISIYGMLNPISLRYSWTYPEIEGVITYYYYPMFELAVKYLLDPKGMGRSFHDVRDVLFDAANEIPFNTSLENRFGISQMAYETQFFDLMQAYLE